MERKEAMLILTSVLILSALFNGQVHDEFAYVITIVFSVLGVVALFVTILLYGNPHSKR